MKLKINQFIIIFSLIFKGLLSAQTDVQDTSRSTNNSTTSVNPSSLDSNRYDLRKVIQFAIEHSPRFDSLKRQLQISRLEKESAQARWYPSMDLAATHGIEDENPRVGTTPWASKFSLSLTENLYDNGITSTQFKIATLELELNELKFQDQRNQISLEVVRAFLDYSLQVKLLEIQDKQFKLLSKQSNLTSREFYNGLKTKKDFLRFKTQVSRAEIELVNVKNSVEKSKVELKNLMGIGLQPHVDIEFTPLSLENLNFKTDNADLILENHLQFRVAQLQKKINELNSDLVRRKQYPEWYLSAGAEYTSSDYLDTGRSFSDNDRFGWNALLTVKYNFLDWGIRTRDAEISAQRAIIQGNEVDTNLLSLNSTLEKLKLNSHQIQSNFRLARELLALERDNIALIEREYRNGRVSYLDLITGLNDLADSERKYYSATLDLKQTHYTWLYHQGKLYDEFFQ